jgi:four helix bundle protein
MESKRIESFEDLVVWQKSHHLSCDIYSATSKFPKREQNSIAQQLREAVAQVPINIAFGFAIRGRKNKIYYYEAALLSIEKVRCLVLLAKDLGHYKNPGPSLEEGLVIEKMLKRLIHSVSIPDRRS